MCPSVLLSEVLQVRVAPPPPKCSQQAAAAGGSGLVLLSVSVGLEELGAGLNGSEGGAGGSTCGGFFHGSCLRVWAF